MLVILHQILWGSNLDGSYFNNFNSDTDVSEILRFVAGLLSSSAANPTANSRTYSSISENKSNTTTGTAPRLCINRPRKDIEFLIGKGFASVGGTIFPGKTIYTNTGYSISYSSVAGGSSAVESSNDSQLFGLGALSSGNAAELRVSGSHTFKFFESKRN